MIGQVQNFHLAYNNGGVSNAVSPRNKHIKANNQTTITEQHAPEPISTRNHRDLSLQAQLSNQLKNRRKPEVKQSANQFDTMSPTARYLAQTIVPELGTPGANKRVVPVRRTNVSI